MKKLLRGAAFASIFLECFGEITEEREKTPLFPREWNKIELGLDRMPEPNVHPLEFSRENARHESSGHFKGTHIVFYKEREGLVGVKVVTADGGFEKSVPVRVINEILAEFEGVKGKSANEARGNKWNPTKGFSMRYRIGHRDEKGDVITTGIISDSNSPTSHELGVKKLKKWIEYLGKIK